MEENSLGKGGWDGVGEGGYLVGREEKAAALHVGHTGIIHIRN